MREDLVKRLKENPDFEDASVDEILRILIDQTDLLEVVCCLDMIAIKDGTRVAAFDWSGMTYPNGPLANIDIPAPPWKLDADGIKRIINEDKDIPVLVQVKNPKEDPDCPNGLMTQEDIDLNEKAKREQLKNGSSQSDI